MNYGLVPADLVDDATQPVEVAEGADWRFCSCRSGPSGILCWPISRSGCSAGVDEANPARTIEQIFSAADALTPQSVTVDGRFVDAAADPDVFWNALVMPSARFTGTES